MGRSVTFLLFLWMMISIAGNVLVGSVPFATTTLTQGLSETGTTIYVSSTEGFPDSGLIQILDERIYYSKKTANTFTQNVGAGWVAKQMIRGADDTDAAAHNQGEFVRSIESGMLNSSVQYNIAIIADSAGAQAFTAIPLALLRLLMSFLKPPLGFLGTDLAIILYIYIAIGIGVIVAFGVQLAGGRRVG